MDILGEKKYILHIHKKNSMLETKPLTLDEVKERIQEEKQNENVKGLFVQEVYEV